MTAAGGLIQRSTGGGVLITALAMLPSMLVDAASQDPEWQVFGLAAILSGFIGAAMVLSAQGKRWDLSPRSLVPGLLIAILSMAAVAAIPFGMGSAHLVPVDAAFESISALTATGGTVIGHLWSLSPGLALFRGTLQWLGGALALALGIAILPYLKMGGMQFLHFETLTGVAAMKRIRRLAVSLALLYAGISVLLAMALWIAGMTGLDASVHAMGLVSTGGASTWDGSLGHYPGFWIDGIAIIGMVLGGLPFPLLLAAVQGRPEALVRDRQVQIFAVLILTASVIMTLWISRHWSWPWPESLAAASVSAVSAVTGSGYRTELGLNWVGFPGVFLLFLTALGGCAGSTSGGLKLFRLRAMIHEVRRQLTYLIRPHEVRKQVFDDGARRQVMAFAFVYAMAFGGLALGLGAQGLDMLTALGCAVSAMANADLGLGPILGHSGGYGLLPDGAKLLLMAGMVFGRVEMFPILALFTSAFWRK